MSRVFKRCLGTQEVRGFLKKCENGFDGVLKKMSIIEAENGTCLAELQVEEEHLNPMQGLHGGLMATIVDVATSYALLTHTKTVGIPSVSVDLNMSYMKTAAMGETIQIKAETIRAGNKIGFTECTISNKKTGEILAKGSHTKYLFRRDA